MDEIEAKVRCLELAATVTARLNDNAADSIVQIAKVMYTFVQTPSTAQVTDEPSGATDKPKRRLRQDTPDVLS